MVPSSKLHPLVNRFLTIAAEKKVTSAQLEIKVGIGRNTVYCWKKGVAPSIYLFDLVLRWMGYKLTIVPLEEGE